MISWVIYVAVGLIIGGATGFFIGRLDDFPQREKKAMQEKLDQAEKDLATYRHEVTEHFVETAGLINNLTESYQAVHEHLAKGAQGLCDHRVAVNRLHVTRTDTLENPDTGHVAASENEPATTSISETIQSPASANATEPEIEPETTDTAKSAEPEKSETEPKEPEVAANESVIIGDDQAKADEKSTDAVQEKEDKDHKDEQAALSDQNAATMASRMVH